MDNTLVRSTLAEFVGTFTLVFIGMGSVVVLPVFGIVAPALGHGLVLVGLIYAYGYISGAQFNPAVTVGLLVGGKQDLVKSIVHIVTQFIAGIVAAFILVALLGGAENPALLEFLGDASFNYGQTKGFLTDDYVWQAAAIEGIIAFLLVSVVYHAAVFKRAGDMHGVAIGLTLAALIFATGAMTGASVNPARTLGPALAANDLAYVLPYLVGLFLGGAAGGIFHAYVLPAPQGDY